MSPAPSPARSGPRDRLAGLGLDAPLGQVPRLAAAHLQALRRLGLVSVRDLLWYRPRRYDDQRQRLSLAQLQAGVAATVEVELLDVRQRRARWRALQLVEARVGDESGQLAVVWFNQPHLSRLLHPGARLLLHGKAVRRQDGRLQLRNPQVELERRTPAPASVGVIAPTYPETQGVRSSWLRPLVRLLLPLARDIVDPLPAELVRRERLAPLARAVHDIHFPGDEQARREAEQRFGFEELLYPQLAALLARRQRLRRAGVRSPYSIPVAREFRDSLPFELTQDQRRAAHEVLTDMDRPAPMNRLLQGDVGSGKTVVAAMAARMAIAARHQVVLMAPTEILARQHFATMRDLLSRFEIWPRLLVGSTRVRERREVLGGLASGADRLLVGTHALIEDDVLLPDLGLCIIDEQHRFGVAQRHRLLEKARVSPDFLSMTATPIPRSLQRTLYGDLDVSEIRHLPPGRVPVETRLVEPEGREDAYRFIRAQVAGGRQGFVICPLVEDTPAQEAISATAEYERLRTEVFPDLRLTLVHGRLGGREKAARMEAFAEGRFDLLVATSVVEVGVDVANATVMAVEGAEHFGLAQLHQFRGRIGRGQHASHMLLFSSADDSAARSRLEELCSHSDGFELAEIDLRQRGPGDPYGLRQHGLPEIQVADLLNEALRRRAAAAAETLLDRDPELRDPALRQQMRRYQVVFDFD